MSDEDTVLVLHDAELDPSPFLKRLLPTATPDPDSSSLAWTIDNKYYTASVTVQPVSLGNPIPDAPVVVYLFSGVPPNPFPAALTRLSVSDPPPDIFLAVCQEGHVSDADDERFGALGIDVVNEAGPRDDDDDEKQSIRQTLQTHMWSSMERKPVGRPVREVDSLDSPHAFPVTFGGEGEDDAEVMEGYAPVPDDEFGDFAQAQDRLDAWLDSDGDTNGHERNHQFEDDFGPLPAEEEENVRELADDMAGLGPGLDPTPILLHLQAVRAELSLVEDEDERRLRAGEEVARVMRDLGLGEVDFSEWDDDM